MSHLLGPDILGTGPHADATAEHTLNYGQSGGIHSGKSDAHVLKQSRPTQALDHKDDKTDQGTPISTNYTSTMLGGSDNCLWKGHSIRRDKKIHQLHETVVIEGVPFLLKSEPQNKERRDNGDDTRKEMLLRDLYEVPPATPACVQTWPFLAPEGVPH